LLRSVDPELADWTTRTKTNALLADIFDELAWIHASLESIRTRKPVRRPTLIKRPAANAGPNETRKIGSGALPPAELHEWIERKAAENARNSKGDNNGNAGPSRRTADINE
jgi:hypothetical protein